MPDVREKLVELMDEYLYPSSVEGMADHLIANGVTIQRWIPVTERLPEPFEVVLVYDHTGKRINWAYMTRHREWVGVILSHIVTHWMPLPEPPKEE